MPMWGGYRGGPWSGLGWLAPVTALFFMGLMMFLRFRLMARTVSRGREGSEAVHRAAEVGELRREVQRLREEVRRLQDRR
jgi:hypothetical protein